MRRALAVGALAVLLGALAVEYRAARRIDTCAARLVDERRAAGGLLEAPLTVGRLATAATVEHVFSRPKDRAFARVGLVVRTTETSTAAELLTVLLDLSVLPECRFLADYEPGAFSGAR